MMNQAKRRTYRRHCLTCDRKIPAGILYCGRCYEGFPPDRRREIAKRLEGRRFAKGAVR